MKVFTDRLKLEQQAHDSKYSVKSLSTMVGLSSRQFRYLFEKEVGLPPKVWLIECRVRRAVHMIEAGISLEEIQEELGYSTVAHLRTDIKNHTGTTPNKILLYVKMSRASHDYV